MAGTLLDWISCSFSRFDIGTPEKSSRSVHTYHRAIPGQHGT